MQRFPVRAPVTSKTIAHASRGVRGLALGCAAAAAFASLAPSAAAAREPSTRLVECGDQSCLVITGHRDDPTATVAINGQAVPVEGGNGWRVSLPVETVRAWSDPHARTIEVSLLDAGIEAETTSVDLPIGLLGNVTDLAALEIIAR